MNLLEFTYSDDDYIPWCTNLPKEIYITRVLFLWLNTLEWIPLFNQY